MYDFVEPIGGNLSSVGRGNKSPERKALEELPIGKAVNIPKERASRGSIQNWTWDIGRKRGIKLSCRSFGDNWHVTATSLVPIP